MKFDRKPPLVARSPARLPRRVLRSNSTALQTPPGSLTKSSKPIPSWNIEESEIRLEYDSISCELRALAKKVKDELGSGESETAMAAAGSSLSVNSTLLFERGRFYDEYSARRNERLRRKKGETKDEPKTAYKLGVTVGSSKRRNSKKVESLRKPASAVACSVERSGNPRYLLRSMTKENKKPPLAVNNEKSVIGSEKRTGARKGRII